MRSRVLELGCIYSTSISFCGGKYTQVFLSPQPWFSMCSGCFPGQLRLARAVAANLSFDDLPCPPPTATPPPTTTPKNEKTTIFSGGTIITMAHGSFSPVEALAVDDVTGRISAVGSIAHVRQVAGPSAGVVDLEGKCLLPGFVEPHLHLGLTALIGHAFVNLTPPGISTVDEAIGALKHHVSKTKPGDWLAGYGYDPSRCKVHVDLTVDLLDGVSTVVPILVLNDSGHIGYVNNAAFKCLGITKDTKDPAGGEYQHYSNGDLTGVIFEQAITPFTHKLTRPSNTDFLRYCNATLDAWSRMGCTTVFDAGIGIINENNTGDANAMVTLANQPYCPIRLTGALTPGLAGLLGFKDKPPPYTNGKFSTSSIKFWADGSDQGFTGAVRGPYLNNQGWGLLNWSDFELRSAMAPWQKDGWQLLVHSNGDRATDQVLGAYDAILNHQPDKNPKMLHRIEHFTITVPEQIQQAKRLNLGVTHLMGHVYYWGAAFRDYILGNPRAERIDPVADDAAHDLVFSFHSDSPVTDVNPLLYVQTAVTRKLYKSTEVLGLAQCVDLETALKGVTINAARQCMLDDITGSLEVGKSADFVLLGKDPRQELPDEISTIPVLGTWLAGKKQLLWQRNE